MQLFVALFLCIALKFAIGLPVRESLPVDRERKEIVELLLKNGANVTIGDDCKVTPLHIAVQKEGDDPTISVSLIKNGADVNSKTNKSKTPLGMTPLANTKIIKLLLQNGANVVNETSVTRKFFDAIRSGSGEVVSMLVGNGINVNAAYDNETPLLTAFRAGKINVAKILISNGADVNIPDAGGNTILHIAADRGNRALVELTIDSLLNRQVNDDNDEKNGTVNEDHTKSAVKNRRFINLRNSYGKTALYLASSGREDDDFAIMEKLIENCAHLNIRDKLNMRTPLHEAAFQGHTRFVEILVKNGADKTLTDSHGDIALRLTWRPPLAVQNLLEGPTYPDIRNCLAFHIAVKKGNLSLVRNLTETYDIDGVDESGDTPLLIAVQKGYKEMVEFLIEIGANVNLKDFEGNSPLSIAAEKCYPEIAEVLVKKGADIESKNSQSKTPYFTASDKNCNQVAEMLMKNEANVNITKTSSMNESQNNGDMGPTTHDKESEPTKSNQEFQLGDFEDIETTTYENIDDSNNFDWS